MESLLESLTITEAIMVDVDDIRDEDFEVFDDNETVVFEPDGEAAELLSDEEYRRLGEIREKEKRFLDLPQVEEGIFEYEKALRVNDTAIAAAAAAFHGKHGRYDFKREVVTTLDLDVSAGIAGGGLDEALFLVDFPERLRHHDLCKVFSLERDGSKERTRFVRSILYYGNGLRRQGKESACCEIVKEIADSLERAGNLQVTFLMLAKTMAGWFGLESIIQTRDRETADALEGGFVWNASTSDNRVCRCFLQFLKTAVKAHVACTRYTRSTEYYGTIHRAVGLSRERETCRFLLFLRYRLETDGFLLRMKWWKLEGTTAPSA